jgi:hypothetical protein
MPQAVQVVAFEGDAVSPEMGGRPIYFRCHVRPERSVYPPVLATAYERPFCTDGRPSEGKARSGLLAGAGNPFFYSTRTFENPDEANLDVQILAFSHAVPAWRHRYGTLDLRSAFTPGQSRYSRPSLT